MSQSMKKSCEIFKTHLKKYNIPLNNEEVNYNRYGKSTKRKKYDAHYQIIANKINQIDVDKIDYIQRDCFHIGLKFGGEWSRLLTMCRVSVLKQRYSPSSSNQKYIPANHVQKNLNMKSYSFSQRVIGCINKYIIIMQ